MRFAAMRLLVVTINARPPARLPSWLGRSAGTFVNRTSDLSQSGLPVADPATATLTIEPPPLFARSFAPAFIGLELDSTLTFSIDNSASALAASSLAFTDSLPPGVVVATPPNASTTCTGGTLTATAGSGVISYTGGTVGASASCLVMVDVTGNSAGAKVNTTGDLTSSSGNSGSATDTLTVNPQPGFSKAFSPDTIAPGGTSTLTFTIDNTSSTVDATSLDFTDSLPAGVEIETPYNAATTCTGGTLAAVAGAGVISYSGGGSVSAGASCTVTVDVTSSTPGPHPNTSGNLTSSLGDSGNASDTLTVNPLLGQLTVTKVPDSLTVVQGGTATFTITIENTGVNNLVNITVDDPLTPSCNQAAGALANLGPGESHSYTCVTDPLGVTFTNEVTVTAELANPPNGLSTLTGPVQVTAVATAKVVVTPSDKVPTLSDLGLLILLLLLGGSGYLLLRRRLDG